jgi:hypothetical protein
MIKRIVQNDQSQKNGPFFTFQNPPACFHKFFKYLDKPKNNGEIGTGKKRT